MEQWLTTPIWHTLSLLLIILLIGVPKNGTQTTYYIKPTPNTLCPGEPCHTLFEYDFKNFSSNTTLVFLPGDHTLNYTITVENVSNYGVDTYQPDYYYPHSSFTLLGSPSSLPENTSRIVCTGPAGFVFSEINELHISALAFISCGHNGSAAVNIQTVSSVNISNCTFQSNTNSQPGPSNNGFGGAIHVRNTTLTLARNIFQWNFAYYGGAVDASANSNLTVSQNVFHNNTAYGGGALSAFTSNTLTLSENIFQNNHADLSGGTLYAQEHNTLSISENRFQMNTAEYGGTFYAYSNNTLTLSENRFQINTAEYGGTFYAYSNNTLSISENRFQMNTAEYGGTFYAYSNNTLTLSENTFRNSSADTSAAILYAYNHNTLTVSENTFQTNSAEYGGIFYAYANNTFALFDNTFQSNSAYQTGGVLYVHTNNTLLLSANTLQNNSAGFAGGAIEAYTNNMLTLSDNSFQNNSADVGGALDVFTDNALTLSANTFWNNSAYVGGAVFAETKNTLTVSESTFQNNFAGNKGGALNVNKSNTLTLSNNIFQNNYANRNGGVLYALTINTLALLNNTFQINSADFSGGALYVHEDNILNVTENVFQMNSAVYGGAYYAHINNTLTLSENTFQSNSAGYAGGAFEAYTNSTLTLSKNTFQNNSADYGGVFFSSINNNLTLSQNTFQNNSAYRSAGGFYTHEHNTLTVSENMFQNNSAEFGGTLFAETNNTLTLINNTFHSNSAALYGGALFANMNNTLTLLGNAFLNSTSNGGGALYVSQSTIHFIDNILTGNAAQSGGGAVFCLNNSTLSMHGSHRLQNNTSQYYGGGIAALECQVILAGDLLFENNKAGFGGGLYTDQSQVNGYAIFSNNIAREDGGGIYASRSKFYFEKHITFVGNSALNGGGLLLTEDSNLYLQPNTTINFTKNLVKRKGGAIMSDSLSLCVEVSCGFFVESDCFFQIQTHRKYDLFNISEITELRAIRFYFDNNRAYEAGADLYGGSVDNCSLNFINPQLPTGSRRDGIEPHRCPKSGEVFDYISYGEQSLDIASDPLYICACEGGEPNCSISFVTRSVYPGDAMEIPVIAYGQRNGTTPAVIRVTARGRIAINEPESTQNVTRSCTVLKYTVRTHEVGTTQEMTLYADGLCQPKERTDPLVPTNIIKVHVSIRKCPPGFELLQFQPVCSCAERLQRFTNTCAIDDGKVERSPEFWVGYISNSTADGLILHPHCPFDYCTPKKVYIAVDDSDEQCNNNRTGLLCGKCGQNFSLTLGTNRCLQCSNDYLWNIAAFAFAGIVLVLLLLVLRLTVAVGTVNGLIFYGNIFVMNSTTFIKPQSTNILTVFIAWLNLDLGIETCFYNGMDAYTKAWLQFVFPFYVWVLVGIIVLVCHYSSKVATILGTNPIAVLATLFLLAYTKFLRTATAALSYTLLEYPNNSQHAVWLYDANIRYLSDKHLPLFIAALVCLIVLFLPYTVFLIFGQYLRTKSGQWKIVSWVNHHRVLPIVDAYHAPYSDKHRHWTGLMLLVRCILLLVYALNALGDPSVNLLATGSATAVLLILYALLGNRIYKTWYLNALELSFTANLCILSLATLYIRSTGGNQNAVTFTSISTVFVTFIGIVTHHSVQQIKNTPQLWKRMFPHNDRYERIPRNGKNSHLEGIGQSSLPDPSNRYATITHINFRELLTQNELREPCLEMDN